MLEILGYVFSILVGVVLGLLGGGGSILSIPILVYLFNVEPVLAQAYSLFIVGVTSLVGAIPKYRENLVNLKTGFLFGIPSIVAIFATRHWIVPSIPPIIFEAGDFIFTKRELLLGLFCHFDGARLVSTDTQSARSEFGQSKVQGFSGDRGRNLNWILDWTCRSGWRIFDYTGSYISYGPSI